METVGRDRELAVADAFLETAAEGFAAVLLDGEPGIGKTTVWQEILQHARDRGFLVLACAPAEAEEKLGLSALADLLEPVSAKDLAGLPGPQRAALESALLRSEPDGPPPEPRALATAVRSLLAALSDQRPVVIGVDDIHWLDTASATVLGFAMRRLTDRRIAWVLTRRAGEESRLDVDRVVAADALTRVHLGPLTLAGIRHVIQRRHEHPLTRPVLVRAHRNSGGNPLLAIEIARNLARPGDLSGSADTVPDRIRLLISEQLLGLPSATRDALLQASTLGHPTTSLVDEKALLPAEEADLVGIGADGRVEFRHPLVAAAVYETASPAARRDVHRRLAELVTDAEERARHLAAATTQPDEVVARRLEQGAEQARSRGAWDTAAELLERAHAVTPSTMVEESCRRGIAAAEYYVHAGDRQRARAVVEEILAEPLSRPLRADALRLQAEICSHDDNFTEAAVLFEQALAHAEDARLESAIELGLAFLASNGGDFATASLHAHRALELAEAIGDEAALAAALAHTVMYEYLCGQGVDWDRLERALAFDDTTRLVSIQHRPSVIDAFVRLYVGRHAEARDRLSALRDQMVDEGDESDLAFVLLWFSWLETRCGNLAEAAALAQEAAELGQLTGSRSLSAWAQMQHAYVGAHLGEEAETRRVCAEHIELNEQIGHVLMGLWIVATLVHLEVSLGNHEAASRACEPLVAALEEQGIREPIPAFFLPDALEALIALGHLDRAEPIIDDLENRGRELDRAWALATGARCRGLLLAARGDLDGAIAALDRSLAQHERIDLPLERARTLLARGVVERRTRRRAIAKASFEEAREIFERLGTPLWAARANQELDHVGLRRSTGDQLTEGERRVAEMAARGMTIREVASALFLSPKTVDAHLRRAYRKLGITSRAELGARLAELQK